jgi:hypothetical protein
MIQTRYDRVHAQKYAMPNTHMRLILIHDLHMHTRARARTYTLCIQAEEFEKMRCRMVIVHAIRARACTCAHACMQAHTLTHAHTHKKLIGCNIHQPMACTKCPPSHILLATQEKYTRIAEEFRENVLVCRHKI